MSGAGGFRAKQGDVVLILWERSSPFRLTVELLQVDDTSATIKRTGLVGSVLPKSVRLSDRSCGDLVSTSGDSKNMILLDSTWDRPSAITSHSHLCSTAMSLEPGLDSYCWPLHPREFVERVFQKKALVVHGSASRLDKLRGDFHDLDVATMIEHATRVVVWMKTLEGKMQYIDASPSVALNCYNAGHSLYFNPETDVQKRYIEELCRDVGLDFGLEKDGGFGGDLEVFAVRGKHKTPWHLDAQENFTIQLRGTKRWYLAQSGIPDPVTNMHPLSTNTTSVENDRKIHKACDPSVELPPNEFKNVTSFIMRPGSIMYAPAGIWHRVDCESEEGSLSLNFSIDTSRWSDLFVERIVPCLWSREGWRERIRVGSEEAVREKLGAMLRDLGNALSSGEISAADFLPRGLFLASRLPEEIHIGPDTDIYSLLEVERLAENSLVRPNPLSSFDVRRVVSSSSSSSSSSNSPSSLARVHLNAGFGNNEYRSDSCHIISFPVEFCDEVEAILRLSDPFDVHAIVAGKSELAQVVLLQLAAVAVHVGHFTRL